MKFNRLMLMPITNTQISIKRSFLMTESLLIPPMTDEELARMKPARLRGSIWKKYKVRLVEEEKKAMTSCRGNFFAIIGLRWSYEA